MNDGVEKEANSTRRWLVAQNEKLSLFKARRLSRLEYLRNYEISLLAPLSVYLLVSLVTWALGGAGRWQNAIGFIGAIILGIIWVAIYISAILVGIFGTIQRFHDMGKSGWRTLLLLIPLANIVFILILLFKKGEASDNQYGPIPKGVKRTWIPIGVMILLFMVWVGIIVSLLINSSNPLKSFPFSYMSGQLTDQILTTDAQQISAYKARTGELPPSLDALFSTSTDTFFSPIDPWGNGLSYTTTTDGHFTLRSAGPDGILNTGDDIVQAH